MMITEPNEEFINAAIFIAVELNQAESLNDENSISWWTNGSIGTELFYDSKQKLSLGLKIDVPQHWAKYYSLYGYCAIHGIKFIEQRNKGKVT